MYRVLVGKLKDRDYLEYPGVNGRVILKCGDRGGTDVKVPCYKSEGRCFDPNWCHSNFSLT